MAPEEGRAIVPQVRGFNPQQRVQGEATNRCELQNCPRVIHDVHSFLSYFYFGLNPAKRQWEIFCMLWSWGRSSPMLILGNCLSLMLITHRALAIHCHPCGYFHTMISGKQKKAEKMFVYNI